jgi:putative ABC transport system substrate-binding protein
MMTSRRQFNFLLGGAAAAWPVAARGQQGERVWRVGYLVPDVQDDPVARARLAAFREALAKLGWADGRNIRIDYRWSVLGAERLRAAASELVGLTPNVILALGSRASEALRQATRTIPVVFVAAADPLGIGLVESLAHPGGNLTGFTNYDFPMGGKWLEMLKEVAPGIKRVLVILPPGNPGIQGLLRAVEAAAPMLGVQPVAAAVSGAPEIERAVDAFAQEWDGGLVVLPGSRSQGNRDLIVGLAARHRLPAIYANHAFVTSGGLMSYDTDVADTFRRAASYIDRILRGEKPGDLPVQNPTKFNTAINLKTAKALGITFPTTLLLRADEAIE